MKVKLYVPAAVLLLVMTSVSLPACVSPSLASSPLSSVASSLTSPPIITAPPAITPVTPPAEKTVSTTGEATCARVIDGDTIEVFINGKSYDVRYIGIDTPETVHPSKPVEYFGKEASAKNKELVLGKIVRLEKDVSETDNYGRLLRYVWVGSVMINAELVRLGYAQVTTFPPDVKYQEQFLTLQKEAKNAGRGLWAPPQTISSPPATTSPPSHSPCEGATAICKDGTCSYSLHRQGTCSHHGGVQTWLK